MPRPSCIVEYGEIKLTIVQANGRMGMQRSILSYEGTEANQKDAADKKPVDQVIKVWRNVTYPDLIAPVAEAKGTLMVFDEQGEEQIIDLAAWPPLLEQMLLLPDELIAAWERAVYQMNPHWNPEFLVNEQQAKKGVSSSAG